MRRAFLFVLLLTGCKSAREPTRPSGTDSASLPVSPVPDLPPTSSPAPTPKNGKTVVSYSVRFTP